MGGIAGLPTSRAMVSEDLLSALTGWVGRAVNFESRILFLDPAVGASDARILPSLEFARGGGRGILKQQVYRYVPGELLDRSKAGFAIPVGVWLKGPLRDWAEDLLSETALSSDGLFDEGVIRSRWQRHLEGREDATQPIWAVLMFQAWRCAA